MREDKYLQKIISLFRQEGISLSIEEIAERIGVSRKTLYNNFSSKDELIRKSMDTVMEDFCKKVDCMNDFSKPVDECFRLGIDAVRLFFREMSPVFINDMMKFYPQMTSEDHSKGSTYFIEELKKNIERGQAGHVYREELDAGLVSQYISYSILSFFRKSVMMRNNYSAEYYFSQIVDFNLEALRKH